VVRFLGVRRLVTALVQGVVDAEIRCTKAVTSPRTPRRRTLPRGLRNRDVRYTVAPLEFVISWSSGVYAIPCAEATASYVQ